MSRRFDTASRVVGGGDTGLATGVAGGCIGRKSTGLYRRIVRG